MIDQLQAHARVWIYQNTSTLKTEQAERIEKKMANFLSSWSTHGQSLVAASKIYHNRFLVIAVDQQIAAASGCSIDSSVRFMQVLEQEEKLNIFDRMYFSFRDSLNEVKTVSKKELQMLIHDGIITQSTIFFDTMVNTLGDLRSDWEKPLSTFWLRKLVVFPTQSL